jgi:hypothetical protein
MKMNTKHSKNMFFRQEKHSFTEFLRVTAGWLAVGALMLLAVMILIAFRPAYSYATNTDWHDDAVSRQIQAEARKLWREEHGDWQPNLTPAAEAELVRYTAQKQTEIDRALGVAK